MNATVAKALAAIREQLATIEVAVADVPAIHVDAPPVATAPHGSYAFDAAGFLTSPAPRMVGNVRVEPVVGADCPRTVTVAQTGHVLCEPRPDLGEGFSAYLWRVCEQCEGSLAQGGGIFFAGDHAFDRFGGFKADGSNWPIAADFWYARFNGQINAFLTPAEQAEQAEIAKAWAIAGGPGRP